MTSTCIAAVAILAVLVALRLITLVWAGGYDARFYNAMSVRPFSAEALAKTAPYSWRLMPATLIALAPIPKETAWHLFNWVAIFFPTLLLFDLLLRESDLLTGDAMGTFFTSFPGSTPASFSYIRPSRTRLTT